ncbi:MAG: choice-of-anchor J domain-containing protein, partial [Methylophagaceae bacterium]
ASLTWTVFGTDTSWVVYLTPSGVAPDTSHLTVISTDTVTFSGLNSNTYYDFYVQGICANNDTSSLTGPFTFVTSCLAISSPYFQNFDNSTAPYFDQCWSSLNNTGVSFANVQSNDNNFNPIRSLPNSIQFYNSSATAGELFFVSPMISDLDSTKRIRFHLNSNSSTADLIVGTMSDPSDAATFTLYETVVNSSFNNGWQEIIVSFNNYTGTDNYVALGHGLNSSFNYVFLDDFHYEDIPSCVKPSALTASNITANNADISWIPGGSEPLWEIQWGTTGFTLGSGVFDTTSLTNYSFTTLSASMGYDFYVRSICSAGDTSYWNGPLSFNTLIQGPVGISCTSGGNAGLIYIDDLESQGPWTGNFGTGTSTGQWNVNSGSTGSFGTGPDIAHSGSSYFYYETSGTNPTSGSIVSPLIDLSTASDDAELSFWLHAYGAEMGTLNLGIGNTPTGPFTNVFSSSNEIQTSNASAYQNVGVNLASYIGQQIYLEFSYISGNSYTGDVAIDLIEVTSCISCPSPLPSSLTVNSITADSVNLSWQGAPTQNSWLVYLVPDNSTLANTTPILVTNDTVNLAVNPNLNYNFYVNGICSAGDTSILAGPISFSTPCVSFVTFPFTEDFNVWPPNCWDLSGGTQSCVHYNNSSVEASFWSWPSGNYAYMTSPVFDVANMVSPELLFDWSHQYNSFYPNDALEVLVSGNGGVSWTQIWFKTATDLESNDGATTASPGTFVSSGRLSLSPFGTSLQIRFNFASGYGPDCFIDNLEIKEAPQNDIGVVVANLPSASTGCEVDSSVVTATIFNFGYLPQSGFNIQYSLNGTPFVETVFDTLQPGDSLLYTFTLPVDLTQDGTYSFDFTTNLANDDDSSNDAYSSTLTFQNYYTP